MDIKKLIENINNQPKDFIVFNIVLNKYNIVSKSQLDFIKKEFGENTTLGKIHKYSKELEKKLIG